ncbi:CDR ABC transporter [Phytophthora cactorum]|nr:CDR ABC transporter [Phytophthora cactorum]
MTGAPPTLGNGITVSEYLGEIFSAKHSDIWPNFGIVLLWIACLRVVSLLALRFVNHQKR